MNAYSRSWQWRASPLTRACRLALSEKALFPATSRHVCGPMSWSPLPSLSRLPPMCRPCMRAGDDAASCLFEKCPVGLLRTRVRLHGQAASKARSSAIARLRVAKGQADEFQRFVAVCQRRGHWSARCSWGLTARQVSCCCGAVHAVRGDPAGGGCASGLPA
jgi:hypothetical protein